MFIESSERFYEVYLWDDEIALQKYLDDKKGGKTLGLTCNEPREALRSKNKIGEIHFAKGQGATPTKKLGRRKKAGKIV